MKNHVKVYLSYYGYGEEDVVVCECGCGGVANQVHHLLPRGRGGKDNIENLIALTMKCHEKAERGVDHKTFNEKLIEIKRKEFYGKIDKADLNKTDL